MRPPACSPSAAYHGTSTQAIADVLGMRQASLYYYFASKEAALELVCEKGVDGFVESAEAIVAGGCGADRQAHAPDRLAPRAQRDQARLRQGLHQRAALSAADGSRRRIGRKQPPHRALL